MCDAVEGRFLNELRVGALRAAVDQARQDQVDVVFLTDSPLGDAIALAAALGLWTSDVILGVRASLHDVPHRHPTVLAREMTALDLLCGARTMLAFIGPFGGRFDGITAEAITLCRGMWGDGVAVGEGPAFPVPGALNRPLPKRPGGPPIALDLTDGSVPSPVLLSLSDLVLVPSGAARPVALPRHIKVCQIQGA